MPLGASQLFGSAGLPGTTQHLFARSGREEIVSSSEFTCAFQHELNRFVNNVTPARSEGHWRRGQLPLVLRTPFVFEA